MLTAIVKPPAATGRLRMVWQFRARLASLWCSQGARVLADNTLRLFVVLEIARQGAGQREIAWHLVTFLLMLPAVLLAPFNGAICNSLPKPAVLAGSAAASSLVIAGFLFLGGPLLLCWGLVAITAALYSPARYALLPAGSADARVGLPRVTSLFETGAFAATVGGLLIGAGYLRGSGLWLLSPIEPDLALIFTVLAVVFALPVRFPSDVRRPEAPRQAVAGFFRDVGRIWREPEARWCLLGLASLRGLITGMTGAILAATLATGDDLSELLQIGVYVLGGVAAGSLLAGFQKHPRRVLGLVPWGALGLTVGLIIAATGNVPGPTLCVVLGVMAGLVNVPLAATYQADVPPDARGNAMAVRNFADYLCIAGMAGLLFVLGRWLGFSASLQLVLLALLAAILTASSWWFLRRETFELIIEGIFLVTYRIRGHGPGKDSVPLRGPVLLIANHACFMDPMLVAKIVPRTVIPMMTSIYYDKPALRWMMQVMFDAIRIEASRFKRETPELDEAIARLDRGRCVIIFPEGAMRRREDLVLRQFGQGIWHILRERPHTPVVVCWIEGNWGSYFSYKNGLPMKNKKFDIRLPIDIVLSEPRVLPPELLADQRATRQRLMEECLALRECLGLAPLAAQAAVEAQRVTDLEGIDK
jgi:1-acyl-sn-glycerol-3-phosphate acyltransferase